MVYAFDSRDFIQITFAEQDRGMLQVWDEACAPSFRAYVAGQGGPLELEDYKGYLRELYQTYPDLQHRVEYQLEDGSTVVSCVILTASNLSVFMVVMDYFDEDGLLEARRMVFDSASLRELGLIQ